MKTACVNYIEKEISISSIKVPGWGGNETDGEFQLWHMAQYNSFVNSSVELIYQNENVEFTDRCVAPFTHLSDKFYSLEIPPMNTAKDHNLLIVPHYKYYNDPEWSTPLPVMCSWETCWWPFSITVVFRYGPKLTKFIKNEPFAQAVIIYPKLIVSKITPDELKEKERIAKFIDGNKNKYITRNWTTNSGVNQDNLYNVLHSLNKYNNLPEEIMNKPKSLRLIGRKNA